MLRERTARLPRGGHRGRRQGRPHPSGAAPGGNERRDRRDSQAPRQVHRRGRGRSIVAPGPLLYRVIWYYRKFSWPGAFLVTWDSIF